MTSLKKGVLDRIIHSTRDAVISLKVNTGLNSALWICGVVTVPALILATFGPEALRNPLLVIASVPVGIYGIGFLYFMLKDPDRLQSEKFRIESRALDIVQEKGGDLSIAAADFEIIANPVLPRLGAPNEREIREVGDDLEEGRE